MWWKLGYSNVVFTAIHDFLSQFTEEQLLAEFEAGRRCLIPNTSSPMTLLPLYDDAMHILNLDPVYAKVKSYMARHTGTAATNKAPAPKAKQRKATATSR